MQSLPSYIKDTEHFLRDLLDLPKLPQNAILVTADVVSMYNNIPHQEGIDIVIKTLQSHPEKLPPYAPPIATLRLLLEHILTSNCFCFVLNLINNTFSN